MYEISNDPPPKHVSLQWIQGRTFFLEVHIKHHLSTLSDSDTYTAFLPEEINELREHEEFLQSFGVTI